MSEGTLSEYCAFVKRYLESGPGDVVVVPWFVTRQELEGVVRARQLMFAERRAYADWMANGG